MAQEIQFLREKISDLERRREEERRLLIDQVEDLRSERDRLLKVLEDQAGTVKLLTNQRQKAEKTAAEEARASAQRGGWLSR